MMIFGKEKSLSLLARITGRGGRGSSEPRKRRKLFSTDIRGDEEITFTIPEQPPIAGSMMDGVAGTHGRPVAYGSMPEAQVGWYLTGLQMSFDMASLVALNWLVDKACAAPAKDAIRQGYALDSTEELEQDEIDKMRGLDAKYSINDLLKDYVHFGRVKGGMAALFKVKNASDDYYLFPFNPDAVAGGGYDGFVLINPDDMSPEMTPENYDPTSRMYYRPTYWIVGNRKIHHTHFTFFVPYPVATKMRPMYRYFGVSVPERVAERVYGAERSANEMPQLLLTKRTRILKNGSDQTVEGSLSRDDLEAVAADMAYMQDNYATSVIGSQDDYYNHETSLADADNVMMSQYQLVAAASETPATKLLETQPRGFNASGDYEESSYRERLESIQTSDLTPLLSRHYTMLARSLGFSMSEVGISWNPLDSPTAKEYAEIAEIKARTAQVLIDTGVIDADIERRRLQQDKDSDYMFIKDAMPSEPIDEAAAEAVERAIGLSYDDDDEAQ